MSDAIPAYKDSLPQAANASFIQSFTIEGLHGYRDVSIDSDYAATIIIARNGSGKTTLLAALNAFLRGHFGRLVNVEFTRIRCKTSHY